VHWADRATLGRASIRTWLYRTATDRCLDALRAASRRLAREWDIPGVVPPEPTRLGEVVWLEPYPDATGDRICAMTRFENSVYPWFGLPPSLPRR
jgi:RNA polymerase sigma-70 factor (ECF subfamily)